MVTAVNDNTLKVWEAATGNLSLVLAVSGISVALEFTVISKSAVYIII